MSPRNHADCDAILIITPAACSDEQRDKEMCGYTNSDIASTSQISHFSMSRGRRIPDAAMMETPRTIKT